MSCPVCGFKEFSFVYPELENGFSVVKCLKCGLLYTYPIPEDNKLLELYKDRYFTERNKRGYNKYFSKETENVILDTLIKNLRDLDFFSWETSIKNKRALDVGCAYGYFIKYLLDRGWDAYGIEPSGFIYEISPFKDRIYNTSWENFSLEEKYDLISFWAVIEHLKDPMGALKKAYSLLNDNGRLFLSTCRYGVISSLFGRRWRFFNLPEHIFFPAKRHILYMLKETGFEVLMVRSYGSGFRGFLKRIMDKLVKLLNIGDMIIVSAKKREGERGRK